MASLASASGAAKAPAGAMLLVVVGDNRYRRLGRNTVYFTKPVAIEHDVAHHQHLDPGNRLRIRVSVMPDDGGTASR